MMKFYATNAPSWWAFQVVSLSSSRRTLKHRNYYHIIVDNGMFSFLQKNTRPDIDVWILRLRKLVYDLERTLKPREICIILPDWFRDPEFTLKVIEKYSSKICRDYKCIAVSHYDYSMPMNHVIQRLLEVEYIDKIGIPCKLYCSRKVGSRRVIRYECQKALIEIAYAVVRDKNRLHALGLGLKRNLLVNISNKISSFDTTSWTRPIKSKPVRHSAKTTREREEYFKMVLREYSSYIYIPDKVMQDITETNKNT